MNPYEVLGVPDDADEETIKHAYRELVKKYHPDKYINNPLADLATEKLKEINEAYDMLMNKGSSDNSSKGSGASYSGNASGSGSFASVRNLISSGRYADAEKALNTLPRNAEWNYLMGICRIRAGWYDSGIEFIRTAVKMDPSNLEYRSTLNSIMNNNSSYQTVGTTNGSGCCSCGSPCDTCLGLFCADSCCECMGGDLISCC